MGSAERIVVRSRRFQILGTVSILVGAGGVLLAFIVATSPGQSFEHPGGFTSGGRVLAMLGCVLVAASFLAFGVGGLRVALIVDDAGLKIRNPFRTTSVGWDSKPKFDTRNREQEVTVAGPITTSLARNRGKMTYRYREIVCIADRKQIWIAATSKMRHRDRADQLLVDLRGAAARFKRT